MVMKIDEKDVISRAGGVDEVQPTLELPEGSGEVFPNIPPSQSANTLFRFFTKLTYLENALQHRALMPRYYGEDVRYLDIGLDEISYPMVCFCDINIHRLRDHIAMYGGYGIAFSKVWGIKAGIQPLQYINAYSPLRKDLTCAFNEAMKRGSEYHDGEDGFAGDVTAAENYLLSQMMFLKPIIGKMPRNHEYITRNFTDECEWRYIPDTTKVDLPQVVVEEDKAAVPLLNKTLQSENCKSCWLKFEYSDIKYIILPRQDSFAELCAILDRNVESLNIKRQLISKVIIWEDAKEDF